MDTPLIQRLSSLVELTDADRLVLRAATPTPFPIAVGRQILSERHDPGQCAVLMSGMAYRYSTLPNGRQQVLGFMIAGDVAGLDGYLLHRRDYSVTALRDCQVAWMPPQAVEALLRHPRIALALWREHLVSTCLLRQWMVQLGQTSARERMAHLFCEMAYRLHPSDYTALKSFAFPISQTLLSETLGLSVVHVSRVLRSLRDGGLVRFHRGRVIVHDWPGLLEAACFDPGYLAPVQESPTGPPMLMTGETR